MTWGDSNKRETISENMDWVQRLSLRDKLNLEGGFTARRQSWRNGERQRNSGPHVFCLTYFLINRKFSGWTGMWGLAGS